MLSAYFCCTVVLLLLLLLKVSEPCTEEGLISGTRYRVQNQFFRASTQDSSYPATSARLDGTSWCSLSTDSLLRPYLEITFGTAVNISTLRIGGYAAIFGDAHFVTKFRVLVDSTGGSLSPIFSSGNTLDFNRSGADVVNIELPFFVTTQVLRIEAVEWYPAHPSQVCMTLEAYGCLAVEPVCESTSLLTNSALMDSVSASPSVPSSGLNMLVDGGSEEWCTKEDINGTFYFQLHFGRPVSLAYMQVKGFKRGVPVFDFQVDAGYVREFTLEVGDGSGGFTTYNLTNTLAFRVAGPDLETMTFWRPVSGSIFRLNVLKYERTVFSNVCWKIMLYGCAVNSTLPATPTGPTAPTDSMTPTGPVAPVGTEMDSSTSVPGTVLSPQQSQRRTVVGGAVGGVLGFFFIVALAVLMAVIVCIFFAKRKSIKIDLNQDFGMGSPEHKVDNAIYGEEVISGPLYMDTANGSAGLKTSYFPAGSDLPSSPPSNTYESIPSSFPRFNEAVQYSKLHDFLDTNCSHGGAESSAHTDEGMYGKLNSNEESTKISGENTLEDTLSDNPLYGRHFS